MTQLYYILFNFANVWTQKHLVYLLLQDWNLYFFNIYSRPQRILCVPTVIGTSSVLGVQPAEQGKIWLNCLIPLLFYSSFRVNPHKKQTFQLEYLGQFILSFVL